MNHLIDDQLVSILWKHLTGEPLNQAEQEIFDRWLAESVHNRNVLAAITDNDKRLSALKFFFNKSKNSQTSWERHILPVIAKDRPARVLPIPNWLKYAAAVFILISASVCFYVLNRSSQKEIKVAKSGDVNPADAILPGGYKAILSSDNGSNVDLEKTTGSITFDNSRITNNLQEGEIVYAASQDQVPLTFNTLSTPRGGSYKVVLPDGSKIWLNAASTLRFPTSFKSEERTLELTGEAYFEVKPVSSFSAGRYNNTSSAKAPFHIKANGIDIKVLGTRFNVKAYADENKVTTTLVEGAVLLNKDGKVCQLKPGEQATVKENASFPEKADVVDTTDAVAWKNGYFSFNGASLDDILNQVRRWYQVNIVFEGDMPRNTYSGFVSRHLTISGITTMLHNHKIETKINGRTLVLYRRQ